MDESARSPRELAVAGMAAAAVALATLWLAAMVVPAPFAPSAAAEAIIRITPGDLATFFIEVLGHWARRLLALGAVGFALWVGGRVLVWTARPGIGALVLSLGAAGASLGSPSQDSNPAAVAAVVAIAGAAYYGLARAAMAAADAGHDAARRRVLRGGFAAAAGLTVGGALMSLMGSLGGPNRNVSLVAPAEPAVLPPPGDFPRIPGLSQEITSVPDHYVVDINLVQPSVDASGWLLSVTGAVDTPLELSFEELQSRFEVMAEHSVLCCVSNEVGGDLIGNSTWGGVRLADVLEAAGLQDAAADVIFRAADGYSDSVPLDVAMHSSALLAVSQNGRPLMQEHGFPCRVRVPAIYGMKNVKWLESIEVVTFDYQGYWQERGWSDSAEVRTQSRIDVAGDDGSASSGEPSWIAGIAWAGLRGISKVEVSTDGGQTWSSARLKPPVSEAAWTLWAYRWTPGSAGAHQVVSRATDGTGRVQTADQSEPHPSGASGYHSRTVDVS